MAVTAVTAVTQLLTPADADRAALVDLIALLDRTAAARGWDLRNAEADLYLNDGPDIAGMVADIGVKRAGVLASAAEYLAALNAE